MVDIRQTIRLYAAGSDMRQHYLQPHAGPAASAHIHFASHRYVPIFQCMHSAPRAQNAQTVELHGFLVCHRSIPWALAIHQSACAFATHACTGEGWMGHQCKDLTQASAAHHPAAHPVPKQSPRAESS